MVSLQLFLEYVKVSKAGNEVTKHTAIIDKLFGGVTVQGFQRLRFIRTIIQFTPLSGFFLEDICLVTICIRLGYA